MKIQRLSEDVIRSSRINGTLYEFTRLSGHDFTEIIARKWTGCQWIQVHYWRSR